MTFTSGKAKTARDILNRKVPAAGTPAASIVYLFLSQLRLLRHDFYERKSENLAVTSPSAGKLAAGIPAALINLFPNQLLPTHMIFTSGKAKSWPSRHNLLGNQLLSYVYLKASYNLYVRFLQVEK